MKLSKLNIKEIEGMVAEGKVVEVRSSIKQGLRVSQRPEKEYIIKITPPIKVSERVSFVNITLQNPGQEPIALQTFEVPANYWLEGIAGYQEK